MAKKNVEKKPAKPTKPAGKKTVKPIKPTGEEPVQPTGPVQPKEPVQEEPEEQLYDLLIPPGVPRKLISEIVNTYDIDVVSRKEKLFFANMDGDEREILAFRGRKEELEKVHQFMLEGLKKFIGE
jgi:hypothetical protein